jgi:hypothetical protein
VDTKIRKRSYWGGLFFFASNGHSMPRLVDCWHRQKWQISPDAFCIHHLILEALQREQHFDVLHKHVELAGPQCSDFI